jgi:hypothetical protein
MYGNKKGKKALLMESNALTVFALSLLTENYTGFYSISAPTVL